MRKAWLANLVRISDAFPDAEPPTPGRPVPVAPSPGAAAAAAAPGPGAMGTGAHWSEGWGLSEPSIFLSCREEGLREMQFHGKSIMHNSKVKGFDYA